MHLIDSLVKPILLYCGDFWGCLKMSKNNSIENLHIMMCKHILGVQKQTTNIGVLLELGKVPIHFEAVKLSVKNWERIRLGQANEFLLTSYYNSMTEKLPWIEGIKGVLENNGMLCLYQTKYGDTPNVYSKIFQRLRDQFHQNAFETIKKEESKLRTYAIFKNNIGFESYLKMKNPNQRSTITKFRLSNHCLMIEVGRHKKIPKHLRFCPFCPNTPETELHFLLYCPTYDTMRNKLLLNTLTTYIDNSTPEGKLKSLLCVMNANTIQYIIDAFDIRSFLLQNAKRIW